LDINFYKKQGIVYIIITLLTLIFGLIYEMFSHGVISKFMLFAFAIPLVLGVAVSFIIYIAKIKTQTRLQMNLYNAGVATMTIGSIIKGVLDIYGTTNWKVYIYLVLGIALLMVSFAVKRLGNNKIKIPLHKEI